MSRTVNHAVHQWTRVRVNECNTFVQRKNVTGKIGQRFLAHSSFPAPKRLDISFLLVCFNTPVFLMPRKKGEKIIITHAGTSSVISYILKNISPFKSIGNIYSFWRLADRVSSGIPRRR